jgi:hypothetical protein
MNHSYRKKKQAEKIEQSLVATSVAALNLQSRVSIVLTINYFSFTY